MTINSKIYDSDVSITTFPPRHQLPTLAPETLPCDAKGERTFALIIKYCILTCDHRYKKTQLRLGSECTYHPGSSPMSQSTTSDKVLFGNKLSSPHNDHYTLNQHQEQPSEKLDSQHPCRYIAKLPLPWTPEQHIMLPIQIINPFLTESL